MSEKVNNPENLKPFAENEDDPLREAVGIWNDRWPREVDSVGIARTLRNAMWDRSQKNSDQG